jgi:hypothetical protein
MGKTGKIPVYYPAVQAPKILLRLLYGICNIYAIIAYIISYVPLGDKIKLILTKDIRII